MTTITATKLEDRVHALDWSDVRRDLDEQGFAVTDRIMSPVQCRELADLFDGGRLSLDDRDGPAPLRRRPLPLLRPSVAGARAGGSNRVLRGARADRQRGEFVLLEQRPRAQSRAHVLRPPRGAFVIFPTRERPNVGRRGYHRVGLRHGVSTVTAGERVTLGVIFHDAT